MTQAAVAYYVNGRMIIAPVVKTTAGLGLAVTPIALGANPDLDAANCALAKALADSDRVVPHPAQNEWKGSFRPFQNAAGVRSYKAFMQDAG